MFDVIRTVDHEEIHRDQLRAPSLGVRLQTRGGRSCHNAKVLLVLWSFGPWQQCPFSNERRTECPSGAGLAEPPNTRMLWTPESDGVRRYVSSDNMFRGISDIV